MAPTGTPQSILNDREQKRRLATKLTAIAISTTAMPRQKTTLTVARIQLAIAKCQRTTSIANLLRECLRFLCECLRFARFAGAAALCWMGGVVALPAEEIDSHTPKVVAVATVPDRALDVDRG